MAALRWSQFLFILIFIAFVISQILIPILLGTLWFPIFRSKQLKLDKKKALLEQELEEAYIESEIKDLEEQLADERDALKSEPIKPKSKEFIN